MNTIYLFIFFLLALLCVGLAITNYLNITIFGDQNELSDFKGNRSNFLQVDGESTIITTFEQFGDPRYKSNALTVEDTPVKIQVLNSTGDVTKSPTINIVNSESENTTINFRINDSTSGSKTINDINLYTSLDSEQYIKFSAGQNSLSFTINDILAPCLFNLAPYLYTDVVNITNQGYYSLTVNRHYVVLPNNNTTEPSGDANFSFSLPTPGISGEYINFMFTGVNTLPISNAKTLKMRWGPEGIIAPNSVIENYFSDQGNYIDQQSDTSNFGAFNTYDANNVLACYCDSGRTLLGGGNSNTTVAGLIVKFSSVPTSKGLKWAVEIDNVYPMVEFQFNTDWSPSGTATSI